MAAGRPTTAVAVAQPGRHRKRCVPCIVQQQPAAQQGRPSITRTGDRTRCWWFAGSWCARQAGKTKGCRLAGSPLSLQWRAGPQHEPLPAAPCARSRQQGCTTVGQLAVKPPAVGGARQVGRGPHCRECGNQSSKAPQGACWPELASYAACFMTGPHSSTARATQSLLRAPSTHRPTFGAPWLPLSLAERRLAAQTPSGAESTATPKPSC